MNKDIWTLIILMGALAFIADVVACKDNNKENHVEPAKENHPVQNLEIRTQAQVLTDWYCRSKGENNTKNGEGFGCTTKQTCETKVALEEPKYEEDRSYCTRHTSVFCFNYKLRIYANLEESGDDDLIEKYHMCLSTEKHCNNVQISNDFADDEGGWFRIYGITRCEQINAPAR